MPHGPWITSNARSPNPLFVRDSVIGKEASANIFFCSQSSVRKELEVSLSSSTDDPPINTRYRSNHQWHSYNVTPEELFDLFGKFGPIRYASPSTSSAARWIPV